MALQIGRRSLETLVADNVPKPKKAKPAAKKTTVTKKPAASAKRR
jgi:hypothetical protein